MRDFYRTYESVPEVMAEAMTIGWSQNIVIMEADLTINEKAWYIRAVQEFGWTKLELTKRIAVTAHLEMSLDISEEVCYTEENSGVGFVSSDDNSFEQPQPNSPVSDEKSGEKSRTGEQVSCRIRCLKSGRNLKPGQSYGEARSVGMRYQRYRGIGVAIYQLRSRQMRPPDWDGPDQPLEYVPHIRRRLRRQDALYQPPWRCGRSLVYG